MSSLCNLLIWHIVDLGKILDNMDIRSLIEVHGEVGLDPGSFESPVVSAH